MTSREDVIEKLASGDTRLHDLDLTGIDLSGLKLDYAEFKRCKLQDIDFSRSSLWRVSFTDTWARRINFRQVFLQEAKFQGAHFWDSDLSGAFLYGADLSDAELEGADLSFADLRGAILRNTKLTDASLTSARTREKDPQDIFESVPVPFAPQIDSPYMCTEIALNILTIRSSYSSLRFSSVGLEALYFLLNRGNSTGVTLSTLVQWHSEGAELSLYQKHTTRNIDDIKLVNYREVCKAFAYYAQNYIEGLDFLTECLCDVNGVPACVHDSYIKIFSMLDPQELPPEAVVRLDKILASPIGRSAMEDIFKQFRRQLPGQKQTPGQKRSRFVFWVKK